MIDLTLHEIHWCVRHGHPVVTLRAADTDRYVAVALASEDAASFAPTPGSGRGGAAGRFSALLDATIAGLGARLTEVRLHVGPDRILRAPIFLLAAGGPLALPAYVVDGILLAYRTRCPLRMADQDLARVPPTTLPASGANPDSHRHRPPGPFRLFIESLDLDGLGPPGAPPVGGC